MVPRMAIALKGAVMRSSRDCCSSSSPGLPDVDGTLLPESCPAGLAPVTVLWLPGSTPVAWKFQSTDACCWPGRPPTGCTHFLAIYITGEDIFVHPRSILGMTPAKSCSYVSRTP